MSYVSTTGGGSCMGAPDTCNVPSPTGTIPTPFVNTAQCAAATGTSNKVKVQNMAVITTSASISMSNGDEAGVAGGVVSGVNMQQVGFKVGSTAVTAEGNPVFFWLSMTAHNGSSMNIPGSQVAPSQTLVMVGR